MRKSTSTSRKITRILNAVFPGTLGSSAVPQSNMSPAWPAKTYIDKTYTDVTVPDAVGELSVPTGDERLDFLHTILIDLLQKNFIRGVRMGDGSLSYLATDAGRSYVAEQLGILDGT